MASNVFGAADSPTLKLHAAETNSFLLFAGWVLEKYGDLLGEKKDNFVMAQACFATTLRIVREHPFTLPPGAQQEFMNSMVKGLKMLQAPGIASRPKMHAMVHMCHDTREKGSPALHATWFDESLNRNLKLIAAGSHSRNFYERVLHSLNETLKRKRPICHLMSEKESFASKNRGPPCRSQQ